MYALKSLKKETGMSSSFIYQIRGAQEKLMSNNYGRRADKEAELESNSFETSETRQQTD